jgi:hypothetical protein
MDGFRTKLAEEDHADDGRLTPYDLKIISTCPLCGEKMNGYVRCAQSIIQQVHFQPCGCEEAKKLFQILIPLYKAIPIDDLYEEDFIKRVAEQLSSFCTQLRVTGLSVSDKILYAFYNKYYT